MSRNKISQMPWDGQDENRKPKKRIFLSIDIIDSSNLKSTSSEKSKETVWVNRFARFLSEAPLKFLAHHAAFIGEYCNNRCENPCKYKTQPWKYLGDEVVLVADLDCPHQASMHILALEKTLSELTEAYAKSEHAEKMEFQGTAWVAGFPVENVELELPTGKDYLGPSMDLGFRLSKYASKNKLIVSASLAYLISVDNTFIENQITWNNTKYSRLPLCFGGYAELKGIEGRHPLLWYPLDTSRENRLSCAPIDDVNDLLTQEVFPEQNKKIRPFILCGKGRPKPSNFNKPTKEYQDKYRVTSILQETIAGTPFYKIAEGIMDNAVISPGEREILMDLAQGLSRTEIAINRGLSINTVKMIINNLYFKMGAENLPDLIRIADNKDGGTSSKKEVFADRLEVLKAVATWETE